MMTLSRKSTTNTTIHYKTTD